jgi:hypothetical protein
LSSCSKSSNVWFSKHGIGQVTRNRDVREKGGGRY